MLLTKNSDSFFKFNLISRNSFFLVKKIQNFMMADRKSFGKVQFCLYFQVNFPPKAEDKQGKDLEVKKRKQMRKKIWKCSRKKEEKNVLRGSCRKRFKCDVKNKIVEVKKKN